MTKWRKYRVLGVAAALALTAAAQSDPARAQFGPIPVFDNARWVDMFLMLQNVRSLTGRIGAALQHVRNAGASLGGGILVDDILIGERYLTSDIQSIGYGIDTVTTQFAAVFPDRDAAGHVAPQDVATLRGGWDDELASSGMAAARAQTALSRLETNTQSAIEVLERSQAATGDTTDEGSQLAKLQALVQMLGIINSDLTTLSTTLSTAERVNADTAAAEASDRELEAAKAQRMLRDFTERQPIPDIDPRILRD